MHAALRVALLGFGAITFVATLRAQSESLPPIFAPRSESKPAAPPSSANPNPGPLASGRVRQLVTAASNRLLADVNVFEAPAGTSDTAAPAPASSTADGGPVQMRRFVVRSLLPGEHEVRPPEIFPPRFTFLDEERDDRRMIGGKKMTLFRLSENKEINLNILQATGRGADHSRELIRAEIEFRLRF